MKSSTFARILAAGLLLGAAAACGGGSDEDGSGGSGGAGSARFSCTKQTGSGTGCQAYVGTSEPIPGMRDACTQGGGQVGESCATDGVVGVCTIASGGGSLRSFYYGYDADGIMTVRSVCTQTGGQWSETA